MREWIVNVGYRTALERVAHLLCEIYWRLDAVGLAQGNSCDMPLTQQDLADALALSSVHVNRTLMALRRAGLLRLQAGRLELLDGRALQMAAGFDPYYLHLERPAGHLWRETAPATSSTCSAASSDAALSR